MSKKTPPTQKRPHAAAGLKALLVTAEHVLQKTGVVRGVRVLSALNQTDGFDCPGCAWPDPVDRARAEFCENGAKAALDEATTRRVTAEFFARYSVSELSKKSERWLNSQGRITEPMVLRPEATHYEAISYPEAFELLGTALASLPSPNAAAFYTSGRTSNEAAFLYQLMVRAWGTNNLPDCSNLCHESSGIALKETLGIGKGTVRLSDFEHASLIFVIGQNPGTNHPRMLSTLREAKLRGATVISVNPLRERGLVRFAHPQDASDLINGGVAIADHFVRPHLNGDLALFRGINKALFDAETRHPASVNRPFIAEHTLGIEDFEKMTRETSWREVEELSGVIRTEIEALAKMIREASGVICTWAMGLTQHANAVATIQEITNLLLLTGNMGRPGAGACPVRGHSNVQGDRTMGIAPALPAEFAARMKDVLGVEVPPRPGLDTVGAISQMAQGKVRAFVALGGNFLSASPDTDFTRRALSKCEITAQISTKLNLSHFYTGKTALIIPCLARSEKVITSQGEQFVSVENSMGIVHASRGKLEPPRSDLMGEATIIARLAQRLLDNAKFGTRSKTLHWKDLETDYGKIRDLIESVIPGFDSYNERIGLEGGFELPNGPRERRFPTQSGKAHFAGSPVSRIQTRPGELILMTIRSHDQFNTTVYSDDDRYRGIFGSRLVLFMNASDLHTLGLSNDVEVVVTSHHMTPQGTEDTRVLKGLRTMSYDIPKGCAAAYFPEANPLIFLEAFADKSRTPASKSVRITVRALEPNHSSNDNGSSLS